MRTRFVTDTSLIPAMVDQIARLFDPDQVILFGSQARGEARPDSDIDLLVVVPETEKPNNDMWAIREALSDFAVPFDVFVTTPGELRRWGALVGRLEREALRDGKILYDRRRGSYAEPWPKCDALRRECQEVAEIDWTGEVRRWLQIAKEDLDEAIHMAGTGRAPRYVGFLAQQSTEKAIKAALIYLGIEFPFTHELDKLVERLPQDWNLAHMQPELKSLSRWAVASRYPMNSEEIIDGVAGLSQAQAVWSSILANLESRGFDVSDFR